ncbi:putative PurR-regulated permease PerM [Microbacterium endophyticum]|uniref:Putative PurR-regulated permease PerM n=1 Tax=Microbacterium endophyticum TaxID=1526412 RepID=A0A7W4V5F1_9MICO|nr:AI-2E family transporter [Microbacterium endophyticum]MBB2977172.1 putative PurR-regulated permease PerM [Microbacterium endophyticum]NIK36026.1 putative PurR-regulated permease PerM [Microbacterium endophyticum]
MTDGTESSATPKSGGTPARSAVLRNPFAFGFFVTLGGLVAILLGLAVSNLTTILIYIAFAMFAALGLDPIVRALERRKVPRTWSIVIVYIGFAAVLAGVLLIVLPTVIRQITQFIDSIPKYFTDFMHSEVYAYINSNFGDAAGDIVKQLQDFIVNPANIAAIGGGVLQFGVSLATGVSGLVIILVLSLYFLASLPMIKSSFYRLTPARNRPGVADLTEQITDSIGGYLMGMVVLAFFNSMFTLVLFLILELPFPALMAVVAFCITIIPLVGPVLFWIIGSLVALLGDPVGALIFSASYLAYMQVEAYFLTPKVMNRTISIPGSLVVIGALVGGTLLGLLGALVAIPVTASLLLILKQVVIPKQDQKI